MRCARGAMLAALTLAAGGPALAAPRKPPVPAALVLKRGNIRLMYRTSDGTADLFWKGRQVLAGFSSAVRLGSRTITSRQYRRRVPATSGHGVTITLTGSGLPAMVQRFTLDGPNRLLVSVEMAGPGLRSNWMAPVTAASPGCVDLGPAADPRALRVPFDNDQWARYDASPVSGPSLSHEVAAFFDNASRMGVVVGSVTHDTWKTGISFSGSAGRLSSLSAYGGAADAQTHDRDPHGTVSGERIVSPTVMVGVYADWRDGLEEYARVNAARAPMLPWAGGVPFGWNSWGKVQARLNYQTAVAVSDFVARDLQPRGFANRGTAAINVDSYWDNLTEDELRRFASHCHARGQKAGIYWAPFVYWGSDLSRRIEGTAFTYGDAVLRTSSGSPVSLDGALALDPTHPGTVGRIDRMIDRFKLFGFDYIKLDFLTHGCLEGGSAAGRHYDRRVSTGIQAYNAGMRHILKRIAGAMFISAAISPLFPNGYAHARRVSCDSFGAIGETEYAMNSAGYGWWLSGRLYAFNDPDHMVLEGHSPEENRSRVTSGAIAGTVFLVGDDLTRPEAQSRAREYLTNRAVNDVARLGRSFRPVEAAAGSRAPDCLVLSSGSRRWLAVFNYDSKAPVSRHIDLTRAGLSGTANYRATDLWTGAVSRVRGAMDVRLGAAEATILRLDPVAPPRG